MDKEKGKNPINEEIHDSNSISSFLNDVYQFPNHLLGTNISLPLSPPPFLSRGETSKQVQGGTSNKKEGAEKSDGVPTAERTRISNILDPIEHEHNVTSGVAASDQAANQVIIGGPIKLDVEGHRPSSTLPCLNHTSSNSQLARHLVFLSETKSSFLGCDLIVPSDTNNVIFNIQTDRQVIVTGPRELDVMGVGSSFTPPSLNRPSSSLQPGRQPVHFGETTGLMARDMEMNQNSSIMNPNFQMSTEANQSREQANVPASSGLQYALCSIGTSSNNTVNQEALVAPGPLRTEFFVSLRELLLDRALRSVINSVHARQLRKWMKKYKRDTITAIQARKLLKLHRYLTRKRREEENEARQMVQPQDHTRSTELATDAPVPSISNCLPHPPMYQQHLENAMLSHLRQQPDRILNYRQWNQQVQPLFAATDFSNSQSIQHQGQSSTKDIICGMLQPQGVSMQSERLSTGTQLLPQTSIVTPQQRYPSPYVDGQFPDPHNRVPGFYN